MVSPELLNELKVIISEDYGFELQPNDLAEVANMLVCLFELLARVDLSKPEMGGD